MRLRPGFAAFALLGLCGCTVGPDFTAPTADVPGQWSGTGAPKEKPPSIVTAAEPASETWWTVFNDPELNTLIDRARDSNLDIRQAAMRIMEARAQSDVAGAAGLPTASFDNSYTRTRISPNGILGVVPLPSGTGAGASAGGGSSALGFPLPGITVPPFDLFQSGFDASWEIDLFGGVRRSVESAEAQTAAAAEDRNDALLSVYAEVARNYMLLRGTQRLIVITQNNLESQRHAYDLTKAQAQGGETSNLDVESASAVLDTTAAQLPLLQDQETRTINALSRLVGREPGALAPELEAAKPLPPVPPRVPIGIPAELARRRPDIRRAEAQLHAATAQIGVAIADLYPKLSLTGSFGLQAVRFNKLGDWASKFYNIGPSLSIPVFNGTTYANIDLEDARQQESAIVYENTVLSALHEVENAVSSYGTEQVRLRSLELAAAANRRSLSLAQQRYKAGLSSFLDVLDAERRLFESESAAVNSSMTISSNLIAIYKALGGGWETAAASADAGAQPSIQPVRATPTP
jgi:NodT family efflux transporter outer membrane factor (OMF) lipoprotein